MRGHHSFYKSSHNVYILLNQQTLHLNQIVCHYSMQLQTTYSMIKPLIIWKTSSIHKLCRLCIICNSKSIYYCSNVKYFIDRLANFSIQSIWTIFNHHMTSNQQLYMLVQMLLMHLLENVLLILVLNCPNCDNKHHSEQHYSVNGIVLCQY